MGIVGYNVCSWQCIHLFYAFRLVESIEGALRATLIKCGEYEMFYSP